MQVIHFYLFCLYLQVNRGTPPRRAQTAEAAFAHLLRPFGRGWPMG